MTLQDECIENVKALEEARCEVEKAAMVAYHAIDLQANKSPTLLPELGDAFIALGRALHLVRECRKNLPGGPPETPAQEEYRRYEGCPAYRAHLFRNATPAQLQELVTATTQEAREVFWGIIESIPSNAFKGKE